MSDRQRLKDSDEILNSLNRSVSYQETSQIRQDGPIPREIVEADVPARRRRGRPPKPRLETDVRQGPDLDFGKYELVRASEPDSVEEPFPTDEFTVPMPPKRGRGRPPKRKPDSSALDSSVQNIEPDEIEALDEEIEGIAIKQYDYESLGVESDSIVPEAESIEEPRPRLLEDDDGRDEFMRELSQRFEEKFTEKFDRVLEEIPRPKPPPPPVKQKKIEVPDEPSFLSFYQPEAGVAANIPTPVNASEPLSPETEEFLERFMDETRVEEANLSMEFKDTLAEKFMRERERYLRELSAAAAMDEMEQPDTPAPESEAARSPRRKLDFQIVPEMHMQEGEASPPPSPTTAHVTYSRDARIRPQVAEPEEVDYYTEKEVKPAVPVQSGKKSSEQLLLELAAQTKAAEQRLGVAGTASRRVTAMQPALTPPTIPASVKATETQKSSPEKESSKRGGILRKVAFSTLIVLALAIGIAAAFKFSGFNGLIGDPSSKLPESSSLVQTAASSGTLTVYENRNHTERGVYSDVLIKRANVKVSNMSVQNLLVISDTDASGEVSLTDVSVDGAIHITSCGINVLNLVDIQTPRLIVNNDNTQVTLRISGNSDIGVVELATPAQLEQYALTAGSPGISDVIVKPLEAGGTMNAWLSGLDLPTLSTWGDTILRFTDTFVGSMSCEGSISLDGTGKVVNMAISAEPGSVNGVSYGAGSNRSIGSLITPLTSAGTTATTPLAITETKSKPLLVVLKGVTIANLNMKNPADMNISATIDSMTVADNMALKGSGTIGSLMVNGRFGDPRLVIDINNLSVPTMTTEAETRLSVSGGGKVNTLICNSSTYALGNKVNLMVVNSDNCVYENEPDRIERASGVRPPESVADNPNMDFSSTAGQESSGISGNNDEGEIGTTCGHARDNGGFIYGDGSRSKPFEVSTPAQLAHINAHLSSFFNQTADIDISEDSQFSGSFPVIAGEDAPFSGLYDGMGYSVSNLRIMTDKKNVGLFGSNIGTIQNVHIISGEVSATLNSGAFVGAISGFNYDGGQVLNCSNRARVTGKDSYAGGITGYNYGGRIKDCYNAAKVVSSNNAGGIAGVNRGDGSVAGSYNVGTVEGGSLSGGVAAANDGKIINCYYLEDTAQRGIGNGEGSAVSKTSDELSSAGMIDEIAAGNESTLWTRGSQNSGSYNYPVLKIPPQTDSQ